VLFAGNAGHGKDTAADMLATVVRARGVTVERMAFADPIKQLAVHLLGIPPEVSYGTQQDKLDFEVYGKSARHWLQWIGTEMARNQIHTDIWVHRFAEKALGSANQLIVGSDCRFRNEMSVMREMLRSKMDLRIIKIVNPRVPVNLAHQSESEVYHIPDEEFDLVIRNTKDLKDLESHITLVANELLQHPA
jgi:hypothetical protein